MGDTNIFHKNVALWAHDAPKIALMLHAMGGDDVVFCKTEAGELNLKQTYEGKTQYIHSNVNAADEAEAWFKGLLLKGIQVLFVYGVGLGYYYDAAKKWLHKDKGRSLVFLEDRVSVIHALLQTEKGTEILKDKQVRLYYFQDVESEEDLFRGISWDYVKMNPLVTALDMYQRCRASLYDELKSRLEYDFVAREAFVDEYLDYSIPYYMSFYPNLLELPHSYLGNRLFGKFVDTPAIICGAGPSLKKNMDVLKTLGDKALIFAGGSAINALNAADFMPHFGAGIDPNKEQYVRVSAQTAVGVPYLYRNRMYHQAFQAIRGPRVYITGGGGYDVCEWFEEKFGIKEEAIDEGYNVVNFCIQVAKEMGCNPIIIVGLDLAFTGMESYAPGVIDESGVSENEILEKEDLDHRAILRTDIYGKPVYTLWKWVAESQWISEFAKEHKKIRLINATEGGIGIPGVPNTDLKTVGDRVLTDTFDLKGRLQNEIAKNAMQSLGVTKEKIVEAMRELQASLDRCVGYFAILIDETLRLMEMIRNKQPLPPNMQTGKAALAESDIDEEPAYKAVLDIFNQIYSMVLTPEMRQLKRHPTRKVPGKAELKRLELRAKKLQFLQNAAKVNSKLIELTLQGKKPE